MSDHHEPPAAVPVVLSWSGGKDSALALRALQEDPTYQVVGLLCSVAEEFGRVSHHGVAVDLVERQARALRLPLHWLKIPPLGPDATCDDMDYRQVVSATLGSLRARGLGHVAYGDIHLEAVRRHRETTLAEAGLRGVFPLWGRDPGGIVDEFVAAGYRAWLCCVEPSLGRAFAGRELDADFAAALPAGIDPAGENGEYHSFVYAGPFSEPLRVERGEVVERGGRFYQDIVPVTRQAVNP